MAGSMTNFMETGICNHVHGGAALSQPTLRCGPFDAVTDAEAGSVTEVSGGSYARITVAWTRTAGQAENSAEIRFSNDSGGAWTIVGWGLWDAATAGNIWLYNTQAEITINDGEDVFIAAGDMAIVYD